MVYENGIVAYGCVVIVHLQRHRGALRSMVPAAEKVPSAIVPTVGEGVRVGRRKLRNSQGLVVPTTVDISLQRQRIGPRWRPVCSKSTTQRIPTVVGSHSRWVDRRHPIK